MSAKFVNPSNSQMPPLLATILVRVFDKAQWVQLSDYVKLRQEYDKLKGAQK